MASLQENPNRSLLSKVPEVTIFFWIIKVLCTTVGETASDFLNVNLGFGLTGTSIVMGAVLLIALFFQFRAKRYIPGLYWLSVVLISIVGTLVTDNMTDAMGIPLEFSTIAFTVLLLITFAAWYLSEKTLSIHSIYTRRREAFYWLTILFTFALGTAAGDLMAESLGLGYLVTGGIVCGVILSVSIAWKLKLDADLAFWLVYIMTRPLGASIGDYLSQPAKYGGLGLGATVTSVLFLLAILLTVVFLSLTKKDQISKPSRQKADQPMRRGFLVQAAAALCVLALAGGAGYSARHAALQGELDGAQPQATASAVAPAPSAATSVALSAGDGQTGQPSATDATVSAAATDQPAATASAAAASAQNSKLGDLSSFATIEQDMLGMVNQGKLDSAKTRADDLEYTWDHAEAHLKPRNAKMWTQVDKTIDTVLRQVRAVHPDAAGCQAALQGSITAMAQ